MLGQRVADRYYCSERATYDIDTGPIGYSDNVVKSKNKLSRNYHTNLSK